MKTSKGTVVVPEELLAVLKGEIEAREFFETLSDSCKRAYCDWVGGAKQPSTREVRAGKALLMLKKRQKTLKT
jgi:uncharacterized protein YdeI (YjbR/CyaY-like superfamily)